MILRPAIPHDAAPLAAILGDFFETAPYLPRLHTTEEDRAFVAGLIVKGAVTVAANPEPCGFLSREGEEISHLYLAPSARGNGIGSRLLQKAQSECVHLKLWCFQQNSAARRFYERHGFRATAETDGSNNEEGCPDIRYEWSAR